MSEFNNEGGVRLTFNLRFEGAKEGDELPPAEAWAFDANGAPLAHAPVLEHRAALTLPAHLANRTVRVFFAAKRERAAHPTVSQLTREGAYEVRRRADLAQAVIEVPIWGPIWNRWFLCPCVVTGQLVTNVTLPSGVVKQLPVCNSQVTICEVWSWPWIFERLPEPILWRLRDEILDLVAGGPPIPGPGPVERTGASARLALTTSPPAAAAPPFLRPPGSAMAHTATRAEATRPSAPAISDPLILDKTRTLAFATQVDQVRAHLIDLAPFFIDWLCWWDWFEPWLWTDCIETVSTDDNGNFFAVLWRICDAPAPNLYFNAQQLQGSNWVTIYEPWVRCGTWWNYACGSSVTLLVTDPAAIPCAPSDPVTPPEGADTWVLVTAVGGSFVWGTSPPSAPPAGWVRQDGETDYGEIVDAPFGGYLGMRSGASINIPSAAVKYYRWSYRMVGTSAWFPMTDTVVRHYVKETPPALPTFPVDIMGPFTVAGESALYLFKPLSPPPPAATDPAGTITYWPNDDLFADIYSGYFNTSTLPGGAAAAAGVYQIKLEVFDENANLVAPGAGTFTFIVPDAVAPDGSITARAADHSELDADGYVFNLHIDNNVCGASISAPTISGLGSADACGFLDYDATSDPVTLAFQATHPNGFATFGFSTVRGVFGVPAADVGWPTEVWAVSAGGFTGDGTGDFTQTLVASTLLDGCVNAAFALDLDVYAKATTGWGDSISAYDASALRAFALALTTP